MTEQIVRNAAWPVWAPWAGSVIGGAAGALAHAPFDFAIAIFVPIVAAFVILQRATTTRGAFAMGWGLGLGYFAATMTWITEPFQVDAAQTGWMAPIALVLLALLLGFFWAGAFALARWTGGRPWMLAVAWAGAELLRAYAFTGFPWAMLPQALVGTWAGQGLAFLGPHGMTLAILCVTALAFSVRGARLVGAGMFVVFALLAVLPYSGPPAQLTTQTVRLIQPNAPQDEKWDPEKIPVFVNRQIDYTAAGEVPSLVIWPETALPYLVEYAQPVFDAVAEAARGAPVVIGMQRQSDAGYHNSLVVLDGAGQVTQTYDKHHLVPFGEYMPLPGLFKSLGIRALAERAETGYTAGPGPQVLDLGPLGKALPLICYEAVFAQDVGGAPERASFLMQLTNDAWFGNRSGPQQHFAQARMRAIEQGLPMVRAANTGISAVIDPKGRILAALGLNEAGYLDAVLPAPAPATLYSRTGDLPWVVIVLAGLIGAVLHRSRRRGTGAIDDPQKGA